MTDTILVLNAGSSTLKFALYGAQPELPLLLGGIISRLAYEPRLKIRCEGKPDADRQLGAGPMTLSAAASLVFDELEARGLRQGISMVGHRIVHGGRMFTAPAVLDREALARLRAFVPLAPLHQPYNLDIVELATRLVPASVQVGCFDTAFHAGRPLLDRLYALPRQLSEDGIVAYGFHGLSYAHIAAVLRTAEGKRAGGRAIVAHLGSGASLCAMYEGRSVATTMGFSALDGLMMSSRCGSLDPGIILHCCGNGA